jgi:hypothetical protein
MIWGKVIKGELEGDLNDDEDEVTSQHGGPKTS